MRAPSFWHDSDSKLAQMLSPFGNTYGYISSWWRKHQKPKKLNIPVICVGNLVVGGEGKTPVAIMLAQALLARKEKKRVHFLSRGYKGSLKGPVLVGDHTFHQVGDEPLMLAKVAPTWVAKDRREGGIAAVEGGAEILILDDGHQSFTLHKDLSLVVIDTDYQFGNRKLFPAGPLREPLQEGLARAQGIVLIGDKKFSFNSPLPAIRVRFTHCEEDLKLLRGKRVLPFAGIGRPEKFFHSLSQSASFYQFDLLKGIPFADHHPYTADEIETLHHQAKEEKAMLVTTEKDLTRIQDKEEIHVVRLVPVVIEGSWETFWEGLDL
jgi:tetraacyldisaccharide 4'-kinase